LLVLTAVAWVTPAPVAGLGLKTLIGWLVSAEDAVLGRDLAFAPVRSLLYDQPSPLPEVWAHLLRFFPVAVAVLWPAVRAVPRELVEAATLDGGPRAAWRAAVWPGVRRAFAVAAVAVALLSLGEVVAAKLVQPPGRHGFAQELFDAMHYGADSTVAAMCLLQVAVLAVLSAILLGRARTG
jgi:iron(III) transport system permease protein